VTFHLRWEMEILLDVLDWDVIHISILTTRLCCCPTFVGSGHIACHLSACFNPFSIASVLLCIEVFIGKW
jgi:hypothetical protein